MAPVYLVQIAALSLQLPEAHLVNDSSLWSINLAYQV